MEGSDYVKKLNWQNVIDVAWIIFCIMMLVFSLADKNYIMATIWLAWCILNYKTDYKN